VKQPLSIRTLIIPVVTALAAIAVISLALMHGPDTAATRPEPKRLENEPHEPATLDPDMPVPAPRPRSY